MEEDVLSFSINCLKDKGCSYAEGRLQQGNANYFLAKNGVLQISSFEDILGIGIRYIFKDTLGFLSLNSLNRSKIKEEIERSFKLTKTASKFTEQIQLTKEEIINKKYKVQQKVKFANVSAEEKIKLLLELHDEIKKRKVSLQGSYLDISDNIIKQHYMNSDGTNIFSEIPYLHFSVIMMLGASNKLSQRMIEKGGTGGFELIKKWDLFKLLEDEVSNLGKALKNGIKVNKGKQDLVVSPEITGIMVHESAGHPTEADRIFGREAAQAGESFIEKKSIGGRIGSDEITIVDDPAIPNSSGYYLYDDEGVRAKKKFLYKKGIITEFLHNRETAFHMGIQSNGSSRANSYDREPIVRMSNTFVLPGKTPEEHLIREVKNGIYLKSYSEWNIDDKRMNQKYVGAEAYQIKNGVITNPVIHPVLEITTPNLWKSVKLIANNLEFNTGNCGKGEPMQGIPVWFGGPSMLIKGVNIY